MVTSICYVHHFYMIDSVFFKRHYMLLGAQYIGNQVLLPLRVLRYYYWVFGGIETRHCWFEIGYFSDCIWLVFRL